MCLFCATTCCPLSHSYVSIATMPFVWMVSPGKVPDTIKSLFAVLVSMWGQNLGTRKNSHICFQDKGRTWPAECKIFSHKYENVLYRCLEGKIQKTHGHVYKHWNRKSAGSFPGTVVSSPRLGCEECHKARRVSQREPLLTSSGVLLTFPYNPGCPFSTAEARAPSRTPSPPHPVIVAWLSQFPCRLPAAPAPGACGETACAQSAWDATESPRQSTCPEWSLPLLSLALTTREGSIAESWEEENEKD